MTTQEEHDRRSLEGELSNAIGVLHEVGDISENLPMEQFHWEAERLGVDPGMVLRLKDMAEAFYTFRDQAIETLEDYVQMLMEQGVSLDAHNESNERVRQMLEERTITAASEIILREVGDEP